MGILLDEQPDYIKGPEDPAKAAEGCYYGGERARCALFETMRSRDTWLCVCLGAVAACFFRRFGDCCSGYSSALRLHFVSAAVIYLCTCLLSAGYYYYDQKKKRSTFSEWNRGEGEAAALRPASPTPGYGSTAR